MKKPTISAYESENGNVIIVLSQDITNLDNYEIIKAYHRFVKSELSLFKLAVENQVKELLQTNLGVVINESDKDTVKKSIEYVKSTYHKQLVIRDRHENTNENVIHKETGITVIVSDNVIECANEISLERVDN